MNDTPNEPLEMLVTDGTPPVLEVDPESPIPGRVVDTEVAGVAGVTDSDPEAATKARARTLRDMTNALRADAEETVRCGNCFAFQPVDAFHQTSTCTLDAPSGRTPEKGERDWCPQFRLGARGIPIQPPQQQQRPPMAVAQGPGRVPKKHGV